MKKHQTLKECVITLKNGISFTQHFNSSWKNNLIESYMFHQCSIDFNSISEMRISLITIYKNSI